MWRLNSEQYSDQDVGGDFWAVGELVREGEWLDGIENWVVGNKAALWGWEGILRGREAGSLRECSYTIAKQSSHVTWIFHFKTWTFVDDSDNFIFNNGFGVPYGTEGGRGDAQYYCQGSWGSEFTCHRWWWQWWEEMRMIRIVEKRDLWEQVSWSRWQTATDFPRDSLGRGLKLIRRRRKWLGGRSFGKTWSRGGRSCRGGKEKVIDKRLTNVDRGLANMMQCDGY